MPSSGNRYSQFVLNILKSPFEGLRDERRNDQTGQIRKHPHEFVLRMEVLMFSTAAAVGYI